MKIKSTLKYVFHFAKYYIDITQKNNVPLELTIDNVEGEILCELKK